LQLSRWLPCSGREQIAFWQHTTNGTDTNASKAYRVVRSQKELKHVWFEIQRG